MYGGASKKEVVDTTQLSLEDFKIKMRELYGEKLFESGFEIMLKNQSIMFDDDSELQYKELMTKVGAIDEKTLS